jgi:predicted nucleotidyltransferase
VLHGDAKPDSDVDVLVEFEPGVRVGLRFFALQEELSNIIGRRVDLNTPNFLSRYFRDQVLKEAEDLYARA